MLRFENEAVKPNRNPQKLKPKHLFMNISHLFICFWCQTKLKSMNPIHLEHCSMSRPMGHNDKIGQYWLSGGWSSEPIRQQGVGQHQDLVRQVKLSPGEICSSSDRNLANRLLSTLQKAWDEIYSPATLNCPIRGISGSAHNCREPK